jgi:hypothetical protein
MLAIPVEEPGKFIPIHALAEDKKLLDRSYTLTRWFNGEQVYPNRSRSGAARTYASLLLRALEQFRRATIELRLTHERGRQLGPDDDGVTRARKALQAAEDELQSLGIEDPDRIVL